MTVSNGKSEQIAEEWKRNGKIGNSQKNEEIGIIWLACVSLEISTCYHINLISLAGNLSFIYFFHLGCRNRKWKNWGKLAYKLTL